jgi:hypothetical protein
MAELMHWAFVHSILKKCLVGDSLPGFVQHRINMRTYFEKIKGRAQIYLPFYGSKPEIWKMFQSEEV